MRRISPMLLIIVAAAFFALTGFQCGSAELTTAKLAMQQKQWGKAEESLMKELQKNDKNGEAWFLLGQVRLELRKYREMNEAYNSALAVSSDHKSEIERNKLAIWAQLYNDGIALYNKGRDEKVKYDEAVESFTTALVLNPDSASTYYVTGLAYYAKGDPDNALKNLDIALKKKPMYADAARLEGKIYMERGVRKKQAKDETGAAADFSLAAGSFEKLNEAEPGDADNITYLIEAYELANQPDKAMKLTKDAVTSDPNNYVYRFAYGVFLLRSTEFSDAVDQFKKALEIEPESGDATYNLGVAYLNWGVAMKEEAESKASDKRDAKIDQSYKEKFKEAVPYLEKSTKNRADDASLWLQLGRVYANLNMVKESKAAFDEADKITKNN
ncbi:MAG: tetratricopeptide repeat protein [Ignavibacteria bacterium]|nr:tetratricopeptide repeat protein [Ignavibacteria bacterium]